MSLTVVRTVRGFDIDVNINYFEIVPHVDLNDQQIWYSDTGGDRPPILFAHGFLLDEEMWDPQVEALRAEFRCISYDSRGFGRTTFDGKPFTYWDLTDDAVALLDHLHIASAPLVGMSAGGFMALRAAIRHPDRFGALAIIASEAGTEDDEAMAGFRAMIADWSINGPANGGAILAHLLIGIPEMEPSWIAKWESWDAGQIAQPGACLFDREDLTDRLGEIHCPVLVVHGAHDEVIPLERAQAVAQGVVDCRGFVPIEGAPHACNLSNPDDVNRAILEFLRDVT